jgi:hypothetical protein
MKHVKMLALAAVAAGALMAFIGAGTASATVLCSTTAETCPTAQKWGAIPLDFSLVKEGSANLTETSGKSIVTCTESTVKGEITNTGSSTETVSGPVTELTFKKCNLPVTVLRKGKLEVHHIAGTSNGTVTAVSTEAEKPAFEVTVNTVLFGSCVFRVENGTDLGTLEEGKPGTFTANAAAIKTIGNSPPCPETSFWSAKYQVTTPENTTLSVSPKTD